MIFDSHAHCVDEYREKNGTLKVTMINDEFEATTHGPQAHTTYRRTDQQTYGRDGRLRFELELRKLIINHAFGRRKKLTAEKN